VQRTTNRLAPEARSPFCARSEARTGVNGDVQQIVAQSADAADLHATVPTLLLELQTILGSLTAAVTATTERGRRPYRPGPDWPARLGELAYGVYLLADQTGVDVAQAVSGTAANLHTYARQTRATAESGWPFDAS
jgi:hypothetical protein